MKMTTVFDSTYISVKIVKILVHRLRLTDERLHSVLNVGTIKFQPDLSLLINETQSQISH